jgi:hypothetical protein
LYEALDRASAGLERARAALDAHIWEHCCMGREGRVTQKGADRYLLDQVRERMGFPATLVAVKAMTKKWPEATLKLVEDKANGPAVIQALPGLWPGPRTANGAFRGRNRARNQRSQRAGHGDPKTVGPAAGRARSFAR